MGHYIRVSTIESHIIRIRQWIRFAGVIFTLAAMAIITWFGDSLRPLLAGAAEFLVYKVIPAAVVWVVLLSLWRLNKVVLARKWFWKKPMRMVAATIPVALVITAYIYGNRLESALENLVANTATSGEVILGPPDPIPSFNEIALLGDADYAVVSTPAFLQPRVISSVFHSDNPSEIGMVVSPSASVAFALEESVSSYILVAKEKRKNSVPSSFFEPRKSVFSSDRPPKVEVVANVSNSLTVLLQEEARNRKRVIITTVSAPAQAKFAQLGERAERFWTVIRIKGEEKDEAIKNPRRLPVGAVLKIPVDPNNPEAGSVEYTVKKGDCLSRIAMNFWGGEGTNPNPTPNGGSIYAFIAYAGPSGP